jgi:hypothetical protein
MKIFYYVILFFGMLLALSSCSADKEKVDVVPVAVEEIEESIPSFEAEARAPLYICADQVTSISPDMILLKLNAEPILLASSYVRLVGVVSGGKPLALIEVGGKGLGVEIGSACGGYKVSNIFNNGIRLVKRRGGE